MKLAGGAGFVLHCSRPRAIDKKLKKMYFALKLIKEILLARTARSDGSPYLGANQSLWAEQAP